MGKAVPFLKGAEMRRWSGIGDGTALPFLLHEPERDRWTFQGRLQHREPEPEEAEA